MSVSIEDTYGNVTTSTDSISVALTPSGFVGATTTVTATGGVANFTNLPIDAAGSYTITATDNAHTAWTATTSSFTVIAAAPSQVIWTTSPGTSIAGSAVAGPPTVKIEDAYNNLVSGAVVNMAVTTGPGVFIASTTSVTTSAPGTAAFPSLFLQAAGNYTITATAGSASATSSSFTVTAASAHAIMIWGGNDQFANVSASFSSPLSVFVTDAYGNPVSGAAVTFAAPSSGVGGSFATGCTSNPFSYTCVATTGANGIAKSSIFTANAIVGPYSVTATIPSSANVTFTETNTKPTLAIISTVQSFATTSTAPGTKSGSVIVQAQDGNGNPVVQTLPLTVNLVYAAVTGTLTLTTPPASVVIPAGASSISFTLVSGSSTAAETFKITASSATYATVIQTPETVYANGTTSNTISTTTQIVSPTSQNATFPISVKNTNGTGNTRSYEVLSVNGLTTGETAIYTSGCVSLTNNSSQTLYENLATDEDATPPPSRPSGSYNLDFVVQVFPSTNCSGTPVNTQVDGTLTVSPGSASTVAIVSGAGQFTTHSTAFAPLTAVVYDADGNPVSGVLVTFLAPASGASGAFAAGCTSNPNSYTCVATTNAEGVATASTFTANATVGNYDVQVTTAPTTAPSPLYVPEANT
jgi:adhesin/invasin